MSGNLDVGSNKLVLDDAYALGSNPFLPEVAFLRLSDDGNFVTVRASKFSSTYMESSEFNGFLSTSYFLTKNLNDAEWLFRTKTAGAWVEVAKMVSGYFELLKAGDIILVANKTIDLRTNLSMLRLPRATAVASVGSCRYNAATDAFDIYDGAVWNPH